MNKVLDTNLIIDENYMASAVVEEQKQQRLPANSHHLRNRTEI